MPDTAVRETTARLRYVPTSPSKVRQVLDLIRGLDVESARDTLQFCDRGAAAPVGKLLDSAVANAEHNDNLPQDELFVARAHADEGPTLKRWRPRARGRGVRIRKRTSHVTIVLARFDEEDLERRREADLATGRVRRRGGRRRPGARGARAGGPDVTAAAEETDELDAEAPDAEAAPPAGDESEETAPAKKAARPAKETPAKKTATKTTAAKTTAKKTPAKKTTKKATKSGGEGAASKRSPAKRARKSTKDED